MSNIPVGQSPTHVMSPPSMLFGDYSSPTSYELEMTRCFSDGWMAVAHRSDVPSVGDVRPISIAGADLMVVRSTDSTVTVFRNVCRWDGTPIVSQPQRGLTCFTGNYHGWQWDLTGKLLSTPYAAGSAADLVPRSDQNNLIEVRSSQWCDLVFVNLSNTSGPLEDTLLPLTQRLAGVDLNACVPALDSSGNPVRLKRTILANWKLCFENDIDVYHESFVHDIYRNSPHSPKVSNGERTYTPICDGYLFGLEAPISQYFTDEELNQFPLVPSTRSHDKVHILDLFPNTQASLFGNHFVLGVFRPISAGVTELEVGFYVHPSVAEERIVGELLLASWAEARDEDVSVVEATQRGRSQLPSFRYVANQFWDSATSDFHQLISTLTNGNNHS